MHFNITDVVEIAGNDELLYVTGVIHDSQRLFVTGISSPEHEISFSEVLTRWSEKPLNP
jgi:hypothetical protein